MMEGAAGVGVFVGAGSTLAAGGEVAFRSRGEEGVGVGRGTVEPAVAATPDDDTGNGARGYADDDYF